MTRANSNWRINISPVALFTVIFLFIGTACGLEDPLTPQGTATLSQGPPELGIHQPIELVHAATDIIAFLQGSLEFDQVYLADQVTLYLAEEGVKPGEQPRQVLDREDLRDPEVWKVYSPRAERTYRFAPPRADADLTTSVGHHFRCMETTLAEHNMQELGLLPHVGTMLYPPDAHTCHESWNLTFVFDPDTRPPTLVAVVYAQWEW